MPDKMSNAWTIGMDSWRMVDNAPSVARSARSADTCFAKVCSHVGEEFHVGEDGVRRTYRRHREADDWS
jgi:hypothetical protein